PMLVFLQHAVSDRKLRLFACACARYLWHLLVDKPYGRVIEIAERFADRLTTTTDLAAARAIAEPIADWGSSGRSPGPLWNAGWFTCPYFGARTEAANPDAPAVVALAVTLDNAPEAIQLALPWVTALGFTPGSQVSILRDIIHPPYRAVVSKASW